MVLEDWSLPLDQIRADSMLPRIELLAIKSEHIHQSFPEGFLLLSAGVL